MKQFKNELQITRKLLDKNLNKWLSIPYGKEKKLIESMRYSSIGLGKAFRPFLVLEVSKILNLDLSIALEIATAIEMVHTYSLIHDDLPAMDNDTLRRGKPTNHIAFDEATAILAGNSLLTLAFQVLTDEKLGIETSIKCKLVNFLAKSAGKDGMTGGQMLDLIGEKEKLDYDEIKHLQTLKTGALLKFSVIAPAIASNASDEQINALTSYSKYIGLLFQITDDILDQTGDEKKMGKTLGKDQKDQKSTFVSMLGLEGSTKKAEELYLKSIQSLIPFGDKACLLKDASKFILTRNY